MMPVTIDSSVVMMMVMMMIGGAVMANRQTHSLPDGVSGRQIQSTHSTR